jgi:phosphoenolpyruvate carboxykinase (ATP)
MTSTPGTITRDLSQHGLRNLNQVYWNLCTPRLYEEAIRRGEARIAHLGPLVVRTGQHTGRSAEDKLVVKEPSSEHNVWWGKVNRPMDPGRFETLERRMLAYCQGRDVFVQDCFAAADPRYRIPLRIITTQAWHNLFARDMFIQARRDELAGHEPELTVIHAPGFHAMPEVDGTRSEVFIVLHFARKLILIGGTAYAGEIKKSVFTAANYLLPRQGVLTMHASANYGAEGDVAVFFGLSGTGKTTLSTESSRTLIGDDEHGWSDSGIFNLEGGCYAKAIHLSPETEPEIYETTRRFGTVLENVAFDSDTGMLNLDDASLTENTRAAYPISHLRHATRTGMGGHPRNILMLTADAFGVLPPVARLTPDQAVYHFLSGYTAKVAGTERGVQEPQATFSACFGAPFMVLPPTVYAQLLGQRILDHDVKVWLVNTGWTGGPYGVGARMALPYTRAMVHAALDGRLDGVPMRTEPYFGLSVPTTCPDVPAELLDPRASWPDPEAYDRQAARLADMFIANFQDFASEVSDDIRQAGPRRA